MISSLTCYPTRLHQELVKHGAGFLQYLDSKTMATHIIASSLTPKKAIEFARYRIVKPAWVTDSIQAGKLLPWTDYRVLDEGPRQKTLKFDGGKVLSQSNSPARTGYKDQTQNSFYNAQFRNSPQSIASPCPRGVTTPPRFISRKPAEPPDFPPLEDTVEDPDVTMANALSEDTPHSISDPNITSPGHRPPSPVTPPKASSKTPQTPTKKDVKPSKNMTTEEYNAWLLTDPHIRKASCANPDFLKQFYSESRLHHLSTWKAELKSRMQRLASERGAAPKPVKRPPGSRRYIVHVDFDSFFCAVSLKKHPDYIDKPAAVAHGSGTGSEIASCNYVARRYGVKNGMWMKKGLELCPELKVLPYDFPAYEDASQKFYEAILDMGGVVQSVSIDEALVDATSIVLQESGSSGRGVDEGSVWREQEEVNRLASELRAKVREKTGCAVSVGIGGNVLLAKVALRKAKPNGQHQIKPEEVLDIVGGLEVTSLPGVAYSIGGKLEELGIKFVSDIRATSKERLTNVLGPKTGEKLWEYARGIDKAEVGDVPPRKSVSAEVNWGIRFVSQAEAEEFVLNLCGELERRLLNEQVRGKHLTVKIMRRALDAPFETAKHLGHGKCDTFNKSTVFGVATHSAETIGREAISILRSYRFSPGDLRGLGVQMTRLDPIKQSGTVDGSQKRLQFQQFTGPSPARRSKPDPIEEAVSPPKATSNTPGRAERDPIDDDPVTPRKPKGSMHPAVVRARYYESDPKATTPLNVSGTQFLLPPNPDPAVVAELPPDIRSRLMGQGRTGPSPPRQASPGALRGQESPPVEEPLPSQIDPEVFNALPEDMKAEVLQTYRRQDTPPAPAPAARSPQPDRVGPQARKGNSPSKKLNSPTKKGIRTMWGKARERQRDAQAGLHQTNFLGARGTEQQENQESEPEELDPEILAALPEDLRREVLEDHRRQRLARKSNLNISGPSRRAVVEQDEGAGEGAAGGQARLTFPAPPPKMAFGRAGLTEPREIRETLDAWHARTRGSGPHEDDVRMLEGYLRGVVLEERNAEKATSLVKWLEWLVTAEGQEEGKGWKAWERALAGVKGVVRGAARERGLGELDI